jgi:glutaminase
LLTAYEAMGSDPMEALDLYTRACSVAVTARDLAVMGATLANGGQNPITHTQVVSAGTAARVLAVMMTAGLYENSGSWAYAVGVPAKSGVGGGIVAVVPGRYAIATFAPPLDKAGNSVRGQAAIEAFVKRVGGNVFAATANGGAEGGSKYGGVGGRR